MTQEWKYIYWCYADENMEPVEELFDMRRDPLELGNLTGSPTHAAVLARMRDLYDDYLRRWSEQCVEAASYTRLPTIFSRHVPWREKSFRDFADSPEEDLYTEMGRKAIMELYKQVVGKAPPTGKR